MRHPVVKVGNTSHVRFGALHQTGLKSFAPYLPVTVVLAAVVHNVVVVQVDSSDQHSRQHEGQAQAHAPAPGPRLVTHQHSSLRILHTDTQRSSALTLHSLLFLRVHWKVINNWSWSTERKRMENILIITSSFDVRGSQNVSASVLIVLVLCAQSASFIVYWQIYW